MNSKFGNCDWAVVWTIFRTTCKVPQFNWNQDQIDTVFVFIDSNDLICLFKTFFSNFDFISHSSLRADQFKVYKNGQ